VKTRYALAFAFVLSAVVPASSQTEAGVTVYGAFSSQPNGIAIACVLNCPIGADHVNAGVGIEGLISHSFANLHLASLSIELPVLAIPDRGTNSPGASFSTLAVTPDLRLNIVPHAPITPFLSAGGGIVHFSGNTPSATKGAVAFGGGVDMKTAVPLLNVRIAVKDLVTPWPSILPKSGVMNNVLVGGGVVLRF